MLHELNIFGEHCDRQIVIIGEGKIGKTIVNYLRLRNMDFLVKAFLVDDGYKKQEMYRNIPIYEMTSFLTKENSNNFIFLNTITSMPNTNYTECLKKKGINCIYDFNSSDIAIKMAMEYWINYFENKGIRIDNEILKVGEFVFPNPLLKTVGKNIQYAFFTDIGDLIIPVWLNDYGHCDEGPYETEHVKIEKGDIVIDCGANIGIVTANAIAEKCQKVYSIEPVLNESLQKCQKIFQEKMSLHLLALSNYTGFSDIYINPDASNDNSMYHIQNSLIQKRTVQVTTLDDFCKDEEITEVNFIKFYIDDLECRMLLGARETIIKYAPKIAIFPYTLHHVNEFHEKLKNIIKNFNENYVIEYAWNKMFAYVEQKDWSDLSE